jgi:four helix bundle protein
MTRENVGFRALTVWQKAQDLAAEIATLVRDLPRDRAADTIGIQLLRSACSIAANIAEGYGRYSEGAYRNHLSIARGSLFETESWIDLLARADYVDKEQLATLLSQCQEIGRLLTTQMRSMGPANGRVIRDEEASYDL